MLGACLATMQWACSPAVEWRQFAPPDLGATVSFPCRPASHARELVLAQQRLRLLLYACKTAGATFAVASAEVDDVRRVGATLRELGEAAARNVGASPGEGRPVQVAGMTPNEHARRFDFAGRLPNGDSATEHVAVFARGGRVYQATVVGVQPSMDMVQTFFDAIRLVA